MSRYAFLENSKTKSKWYVVDRPGEREVMWSPPPTQLLSPAVVIPPPPLPPVEAVVVVPVSIVFIGVISMCRVDPLWLLPRFTALESSTERGKSTCINHLKPNRRLFSGAVDILRNSTTLRKLSFSPTH